jgi:hypothetical protein
VVEARRGAPSALAGYAADSQIFGEQRPDVARPQHVSRDAWRG